MVTRWLALLLLLVYSGTALSSPRESVRDAVADAETLPKEIAYDTLYLDLSDIRADERDEYVRQALDFHANQLSKVRPIKKLRQVTPNLLAARLYHYRWQPEVREKLADIDIHYRVPVVIEKYWPGGIWPNDGKYYAANSFRYKVRSTGIAGDGRYDPAEYDRLSKLTYSRAPIVLASWWFVQSSRQLSLTNQQTGVGYYDWLGIKDRKTFLTLAEFDEAKAIKFGFDLRAALAKSAINQNGRQIGRQQSFFGPAWFTLDSDRADGKSNPIRNLARNDFVHKAEEWYLRLPNGTFAFFLGDNKGKRQDSAPDFIGPDKSPLNTGDDFRVHVGISCIRCHVEGGLRPIEDWVRAHVKNPLQLDADDYKKYEELADQYFSDLNGQLKEDREVYAKALREINGLSPQENAEAVAKLWARYVERMYGTREISEVMGVPEGRLIGALKFYSKRNRGKIDLLLGGLLDVPQAPLRVEHLEELLPLIWKIYGEYQP